VHAQYRHLVSELAPLNLAYLHVHHLGDDALLSELREIWPTAVAVVRYGRDRDHIAADINAGLADIAPLGRFALANPDVVERIRTGAPFNEINPHHHLRRRCRRLHRLPDPGGSRPHSTMGVTANRGIHRRRALARGAAKVYDIGDDELRSVMETNFFGPLQVARAFAPALTAADSAALIDLHSVLAWYPVAGIYSVSKAALASATNALRLELAPSDVQVVGVYMAYVDTAMAAADAPSKIAPEDLVRAVFDTTEAGGYEVLADEQTVQVRSVLNQPVDVLHPQVAQEAHP
jgi:NAD(P)-dependent dehydrogenase (short-subunit alcohol dehydrogenase family)